MGLLGSALSGCKSKQTYWGHRGSTQDKETDVPLPKETSGCFPGLQDIAVAILATL